MTIIPEDKISEVRQTADIVEIISESVILKKTGRNYVGLCPFHSEKTPSFTVSPHKQMFHCFGCGKGGNVFHFLMEQTGATFPETVRMLADRYGIDLPEREMTPEQKRRIGEREKLLKINTMALQYFRYCLLKSDAGEKARIYLKQRGMARNIVDDFELGYIPPGWDNLTVYFQKKGVPRELARKSGLVIASEKYQGRFYDRFRDRIIFPIFDISRQLIGFGGRVLDDSLPKYLNSPETPLYNKRCSLYGLHQAKQRCRETGQVYIVEGYFDLLTLCQYGICNTVATLGTALTPEQIRLLKGFADTMVLVYDSDAAGVKAALRSVDVFMQNDVKARILILPEGYDPDAYLSEFGADAFLRAVDGASAPMRFLIETAVQKHGLSIEGKLRIIADLAVPLASMRDGVARSLYVQELAEKTGIEETAVLERLREYALQEKKAAQLHRHKGGSSLPEGVGPNSENGPALKIEGEASRMERSIISMMLQFPEILPEIIRRHILDYFENPDLKSIGQLILDHRIMHDNESCDLRVDKLVEACSDAEQMQVISSLAIESDVWLPEGCFRLLSQFMFNRTRRNDDLNQKIKAAEESNDQKLLFKLLQEKQFRARRSNVNLVEPAGGKTL